MRYYKGYNLESTTPNKGICVSGADKCQHQQLCFNQLLYVLTLRYSTVSLIFNKIISIKHLYRRDKALFSAGNKSFNVGVNVMTYLNDITKLDEYISEDISDVIAKLEKSFQLKFDKNAFKEVDNFGKLCDVIETYIKYYNKDDCTKQQAFYKIREAISSTQQIDKAQIKLDTTLAELFPKQNRRKQVKEFRKQLGVNLKFLTSPGWLTLILLIEFVTSFIVLFSDWKVGVSGIVFFILASIIANKFTKDLQLETVKELTEKAAREHYIDIRRSKLTMNKNEILEIIKETFSNDLSIDKNYLTRDAAFGWTKSTSANKSIYANSADTTQHQQQ